MNLDILALTPLLDSGGSDWLRLPGYPPSQILYMCRARRAYRAVFA